MSGPRSGIAKPPQPLDRLGPALVRWACATLPKDRRPWGEAVIAELEAAPPGAERLRLAASAAAGLYRIAARDAARGRVADPGLVILATLLGAGAAVIDLTVASRTPMLLLIGLGSLALGMRVPRAAWRWPPLTGGMLPLIIAVTGHAGPYAHDRGDPWFAVMLAVLSTAAGVWVARLWTRRSHATLRRVRP